MGPIDTDGIRNTVTEALLPPSLQSIYGLLVCFLLLEVRKLHALFHTAHAVFHR